MLPGLTVYTAVVPVRTPAPNCVISMTLLSMEARISPLVPINLTVRSHASENAHIVNATVVPFSKQEAGHLMIHHIVVVVEHALAVGPSSSAFLRAS